MEASTVIFIFVALAIATKCVNLIKEVLKCLLLVMGFLFSLRVFLTWGLKPVWKAMAWTATMLWKGLRWVGRKVDDHFTELENMDMTLQNPY